MKLVRMPRDLLHLEAEDLEARGVDGRLSAELQAYLPRATHDQVGLAILAPPRAGTRELLMILARRVGIALRNRNIRQRDGGSNQKRRYGRLCYLPGYVLPVAMRTPEARRSLESEAACFIQDLDLAWSGDTAALDRDVFLDLLDSRLARGLPTFLSATPEALPPPVEGRLRARLRVLEDPG